MRRIAHALLVLPLVIGTLAFGLGGGESQSTMLQRGDDGTVLWGAKGHRIVGYMAQHHLNENAAHAVADLLGPGPMRLAEAGTWADEMRSNPAWRKASPWHYISVDETETYDHLPPVPASEDEISDIVEAILYFEAVLSDRSQPREKQVEALRFLVHFIGDIHQPLHVGRRGDVGGNGIGVNWFGEASNLHTVWDTGLIEQVNLSFSEFTTFINPSVDDDSVAVWQQATMLDWMQEAMILRPAIYELGFLDRDTGRPNLGYEYAFKKTPIVKRQLVLGGIRLAGRLNTIFEGYR